MNIQGFRSSKVILLPGLCFLTVASYIVPPAKGFNEPELARIIFFHLPCAFITTIFVLYASYAGWKYLRTSDWMWECRSRAATEISMVSAIATMVTGILFSKVQWGAWWHWDARQTSFLIVLLLLGAYFALRISFDDEVTRARVSAAYSTAILVPVLFLIFVFPRLPQVLRQSLHPSTTIQKGEFSADYWSVVLGVFALLTWHCVWLFKLNVRTSLLEHKLRTRHGNLENTSHRTTAYRVDPDLSSHE